MSAIVEVNQVSKYFSHIPVLKNVSLSVEAGSTIRIVYSNRSGKSVPVLNHLRFSCPGQRNNQNTGRVTWKQERFPQ